MSRIRDICDIHVITVGITCAYEDETFKGGKQKQKLQSHPIIDCKPALSGLNSPQTTEASQAEGP